MKKLLAVLALLLFASGAAAQVKTNPDFIPGGIYNPTLPTLAQSQAGVFQLDSSGRLIVNVGAGGAGGGAVTGAVGSFLDGWNVTEGAKADTAWTSGSGSMVAILKAIANGITGAIPAGANNIGSVDVLGHAGGALDATAGSPSAAVLSVQGVSSGTTIPVTQSTQYPVGATPQTVSATGTTGATTATLAGATSNYTYLCGFSIRANATAVATGNATVTGVITGTMNFTQWTAPLASGLGVTEEIFTPCIPSASTGASQIAVVSAAPGSGGIVSVTAWGYIKTTTP